jgi:hypothetical protein
MREVQNKICKIKEEVRFFSCKTYDTKQTIHAKKLEKQSIPGFL